MALLSARLFLCSWTTLQRFNPDWLPVADPTCPTSQPPALWTQAQPLSLVFFVCSWLFGVLHLFVSCVAKSTKPQKSRTAFVCLTVCTLPIVERRNLGSQHGSPRIGKTNGKENFPSAVWRTLSEFVIICFPDPVPHFSCESPQSPDSNYDTHQPHRKISSRCLITFSALKPKKKRSPLNYWSSLHH